MKLFPTVSLKAYGVGFSFVCYAIYCCNALGSLIRVGAYVRDASLQMFTRIITYVQLRPPCPHLGYLRACLRIPRREKMRVYERLEGHSVDAFF